MSDFMKPDSIERLLVNFHQVDPSVAKQIRDRLEMAAFEAVRNRELGDLVTELQKQLGIKYDPHRPTGVKTESSIEWTDTNGKSSSS